MKISELRELLKDKKVNEEINKHLWIESQKAGYSIGIERATDEWLRFYAEGWTRYNRPEEYDKRRNRKKKKPAASAKKKAVKQKKTVVKKTVAKKKTVTKKKAVVKKKTIAKKKKKAARR